VLKTCVLSERRRLHAAGIFPGGCGDAAWDPLVHAAVKSSCSGHGSARSPAIGYSSSFVVAMTGRPGSSGAAVERPETGSGFSKARRSSRVEGSRTVRSGRFARCQRAEVRGNTLRRSRSVHEVVAKANRRDPRASDMERRRGGRLGEEKFDYIRVFLSARGQRPYAWITVIGRDADRPRLIHHRQGHVTLSIAAGERAARLPAGRTGDEMRREHQSRSCCLNRPSHACIRS